MPRFSILLAAACLLLSTAPMARELRVATWNLEWLVAPATAHSARLACDAGRRAALPCDVARGLSRDSADLARMAAHARALDADVIAVQEVEDEATLARLFRGYHICLAGGPGLQHTGFAIRPALSHRCEPALQALALGGKYRPGARLTLWAGSRQEIRLLAVHLKSGCSSDPAGSTRAACGPMAAQMRELAGWLDEAENDRLILLGDFNRAGPDLTDPLWQGLIQHPRLPLTDAANGSPFRNCYIGQPFWRSIDHILLGPAIARAMRPGSYRKLRYAAADAMNYRLSDHCPVSIDIEMPD